MIQQATEGGSQAGDLGVGVPTAEDHATPRSGELLVRAGDGDMCGVDRTWMPSGGHKPGDMRNVGEQDGAGFIGNFAKPLEVDYA
ncbi:hypothetical protein D3C80_1983370 [compost metagenome]